MEGPSVKSRIEKSKFLSIDDPAHPRYVKICFVCQDIAKPGKEHLRNYGGIVCYSCRAFWRRSHQKTKTPNFTCKLRDSCVVTVKNRRRCQSCRYKRCLKAGMVPKAVLNEAEKKVRFRKLLQKKQAEELELQPSLTATESTSKSSIHLQPKSTNVKRKPESRMVILQRSEEPREPIDLSVNFQSSWKDHDSTYMDVSTCSGSSSEATVSDSSTWEPLDLSMNVENHIESDGCYLTLPERPMDLSKTQEQEDARASNQDLKDLTSTLERALAQADCQRVQDILEALKKFLTGGDASISADDIRFIFSKISEVFKHFALQQRKFISLPLTHQRWLIQLNTPLFLQLTIAIYLQSFLPERSPIKKKLWAQAYSTEEIFEKLMRLFGLKGNAEHYVNLVVDLKPLLMSPSYEEVALLAYITLFNSNWEEITPTVKVVQKEAKEMLRRHVRTSEGLFGLDSFEWTLLEMDSLFFLQNQV